MQVFEFFFIFIVATLLRWILFVVVFEFKFSWSILIFKYIHCISGFILPLLQCILCMSMSCFQWACLSSLIYGISTRTAVPKDLMQIV